jgi:urease accessory protein
VSAPSATRVYRSGGAPAIQRFAATLGARATLEYVPDRLIASRGARLRQSTDVTLGAGATLLLADSWASGRMARGEDWTFDLLDSALTVRDDRGLLVRERCVLEHDGWAGLGGTERCGYVGTFLAVRSGDADWPALATALAVQIEGAGPASRGGVTLLGRGGVLVRLLCASAPALEAVVESIWSICRRALLGLDPLHLRKL